MESDIVRSEPTTTESMSHLVGYVLTTYEKLEEKLGQPDYIREGTYSNPLDESDGKTSTEWERGSFYVYDWKNESTPKGLHRWHIGGESIEALRHFKELTGLQPLRANQ